ncbi:putative serine/threonine-protein kinase pats1 [Gossypium australe]|uniref:Putative serine/threonine-protein kinase pats1 n=1 Tax=Gossypium australe TaxID=47621 RepID=A0A5B6WPS9_9ROSI|nr:putative serine/threonine-protein kinase pats1 [Gossypium australe]
MLVDSLLLQDWLKLSKAFNDSRNQTVKPENASQRGRKSGNRRGGTNLLLELARELLLQTLLRICMLCPMKIWGYYFPVGLIARNREFVCVKACGTSYATNIISTLSVKEFADVFPKELPELPPTREVEFEIELVPAIAPISIAPY